MVAPPEMSVVVLTHDSFSQKSGCIRHTIAALRGQKGVSFEVVVVDNGSTRADQRSLSSLCSQPFTFSLDIATTDTNLPIGVARNLGAQAAKSGLIVFLDDDAILLEVEALAQVYRIAASASHGYGAKRLWTPAHPWFTSHHERLGDALQNGDYRPLVQCLGRPPFHVPEQCLAFDHSFLGHFGFVQRGLFEAVGGFPDEFVGYGFEDNALAILCYLKSRQYGWLGSLRVAHVDHARPASYDAEHRRNELRYKHFLAARGLRGFNIDLLLGGFTDVAEESILSPL